MVIEPVFTQQAPILTNYDFADLISGKVYKNFYGMETLSGAAVADYFLAANDNNYSSSVVKLVNSDAGSWTQLGATDYTTGEFNTAGTIRGKAIVNISQALHSATSGNTAKMQTTAALYKNTTFLVSGSATLIDKDSDSTEEEITAVELLVPRIQMVKGDELVLRVIVHGNKTGGGGDNNFIYGIDPKDRDDPDSRMSAGTPTQMILSVPFEPLQ